MRPLLLITAVLLGAACRPHHPATVPPARAPRDTARVTQRSPAGARDPALGQRAARLELKVVQQEAQGGEPQSRLHDARDEGARAKAKLPSLAAPAAGPAGM